jgi:hypothetical protein
VGVFECRDLGQREQSLHPPSRRSVLEPPNAERKWRRATQMPMNHPEGDDSTEPENIHRPASTSRTC